MPAIPITQTVKDMWWSNADIPPASSLAAWRRQGVAVSTATSPLTSTLTLPKAISKGVIRIRLSNVGTIAGTFAVAVTGTDGTSTVDLANIPASTSIAITSNANEVERSFPFITELVLTSVSVIA